MGTLLQDLTYATRTLASRRGFTVVAALTLALGIGATAAVFSVVDAVLLRPLPFTEPDRLAMVWVDNTRMGIRTDITSWPSYQQWRTSAAFAEMAGFAPSRSNLTGEGDPERLSGALIQPGFFEVLGVSPARGRSFTAEEGEEGNDQVVILAHGLWERRFGADPGIVGTSILLDGQSHEVVGIMPPGFDFPQETELWQPLAPGQDLREARGSFWLYVVGRLAPDATVERAQAELDAVVARLQREFPDAYGGYGVWVQPMTDHLVGDVRPALVVLSGAVAFVLLIACANLANLLLARAAGREREIAIRSALGAGRGRMVRQLLTESVLLALVGGVGGVLVALWGVRALKALAPPDLPNLAAVAVDGRVLAFTFAVSVATGIAFGLVPALQVSRPRFSESLKEGRQGTGGGLRGRRTRRALVVAEVALALVLLVGAGLLLKSLARVLAVEPGFDPQRSLAVSVALSGERYEEPGRVLAFYDALLERVRGLPGVESAGAVSTVLLGELARSAGISVEGKPAPPPEQRIEVTIDAVTPGVFRALGTPLLAGRDVAETDRADALPVAVINHAMARRFWPGEEPLGKRFKFGGPDSQSPWRTVVGVVGDARRTALEQEPRPSAFLAQAQVEDPAMTLVVRAAGEPEDLARSVAREVRATDPTQPVVRIATLAELLGERLAPRRFSAFLLAVFSGLALVLAAVGVYGVVAYAVAQGTREIGVRMALGARASDVLRQVLGQGVGLVVIGVAIGCAAAWLLTFTVTRTFSGLLFGVAATDPATFAAVAALLMLVAVAASFVPARRAARTDPAVAMRSE